MKALIIGRENVHLHSDGTPWFIQDTAEFLLDILASTIMLLCFYVESQQDFRDTMDMRIENKSRTKTPSFIHRPRSISKRIQLHVPIQQ